MWVWQNIRPNTHGLSYVLSLNACGSSNIPDSTLLDLQCAEPNQLWVWEDARPNTFELNYVLNPNAYGFSKMSDSTLLTSATC